MENGRVDGEAVEESGEGVGGLVAGMGEPAMKALASGVDEGAKLKVEAVGEEAHEAGVESAIFFALVVGAWLVAYQFVAFDDEEGPGGKVGLAS